MRLSYLAALFIIYDEAIIAIVLAIECRKKLLDEGLKCHVWFLAFEHKFPVFEHSQFI